MGYGIDLTAILAAKASKNDLKTQLALLFADNIASLEDHCDKTKLYIL